MIVSPFQQTRITTVASVGSELWVGLGNGQVLLFDVMRNERYGRDVYGAIDDQEEQTVSESDETSSIDSGKFIALVQGSNRKA